ncbi:2-oxoacid dehydrogenases acyltransferase [Caprobacter fermentans]|uniref:2-oxoacid dehydrogenases acyltransferase n=1 Tax=Caproicibacter fermentans TaxID=2576756 RepID=A0A6N8HXC0_9FIRM|nr:hypothetical protein [Caproicibacter fermentans]MVB10392.1 2-oxoacid dehydrogenases acyltransferase [Caproicibacter fermentans]OCN01909.1 hypothetical protein A7X67_03210 [Clostridium sp. W14A]
MENTVYPGRKRMRGDRHDSFRIRKDDPFFSVVPHLMRNRTGSMVFFEEKIEITHLEQFVRRMRRETGMTDLSTLHVVMAAAVRLIALHPGLNRYVSGRKLYARNHIALSIAVKNTMSETGQDTTLKTLFSPTDSLEDIWKKLHDGIAAVKNSAQNNGAYRTAEILRRLPVCLLRFVVFVLWHMDEAGLMPEAIHRVSPFHTSAFVVDIGSTGIGSVYHHLYDFGTCPIFISVGKKETTFRMSRHGIARPVKTINFRFVVDERICDGYYYARAMRHFRRILKNPDVLLTSLPSAVPDPWL